MSEGEVPGATPAERAANLAGALAELGARRVVLVGPGGDQRELRARETDLPAAILTGAAALECPDLGIGADLVSWRWRTADDNAAARLRSALGR